MRRDWTNRHERLDTVMVADALHDVPEMNAVREVAANMGGSLGSSINISTNAGAQLASDLGKGLIQGTSQYIAKKMRTVKVHLKAGYRVMLYQEKD